MAYWTGHLVGLSAAHHLDARSHEQVLTIGSDHFTRADLAGVACFTFLAAQNLTRALRDYGVHSTKDAYERLAPADLAVPGIGAISLAVLGAAFELKGIGGAAPLDSWAERHQQNGKGPRTFDTIKHHQESAHRATRSPRHRGRRR